MAKTATEVAEIKRQIAGIKEVLDALPPEKQAGRMPANIEAFKAGGVKTQWKPGQSGNIKGPGKAKVVFWRYVCKWLECLLCETEDIDESQYTLAQLGALKFARAVAEGKWLQTKEVLDRELGKIGEPRGEEDDRPKAIRYPLTMPFEGQKNEDTRAPKSDSKLPITNSKTQK